MLRSFFARSPRAKTTLAHANHRLQVETLEERRLLSVSGYYSSGSYQMIDYYRAMYTSRPVQYRSLDSLLKRDVKPIVTCPGLREDFCLPDTVSSRSVDRAMGSNVGLDDDWFSIEDRKSSLLDGESLKRRSHSRF